MTTSSAPASASNSFQAPMSRWWDGIAGRSHVAPTNRDGEPDSTRIVQVAEEVSSLEHDWRTLETRTADANLFQSFTWCSTWVEAAREAGRPIRLRIITIRDGGTLCLLWPLSVRRVFGVTVLHSIGEPATQNAGVLVADGADEGALVRLAWETIRSWRDIDLVELLRIRDDSSLRELPTLLGTRSWQRTAAAPAFEASPGAVVLPSRLRSSRTRNALRRHWRDLDRIGRTTFELTQCRTSGEQALAEALHLKGDWLRRRGIASGGYSHPINSDFLQRLACSGLFQISLLRVGERTVAVELGVRRRDTYWSLVQSYQTDLAAHSPGRLLSWRLLDACIEQGVTRFDFLAPAQPHKVEWSNTQVPVRSLLVPLTARGILIGAYLAALKPRLKRLHQALPAALRRAAAPLVNIMR